MPDTRTAAASGTGHHGVWVPQACPQLAELCSPWAGQDAATWQGEAQEWALSCPRCARSPRDLPASSGRVQGPCRGYCRDFTIALRAWGVSETEGDEL